MLAGCEGEGPEDFEEDPREERLPLGVPPNCWLAVAFNDDVGLSLPPPFPPPPPPPPPLEMEGTKEEEGGLEAPEVGEERAEKVGSTV